MPLSDSTTHLGLNTDAPPDRLQGQAFRCANVLPSSSENMRPRQGSELVAHYEPGILGRCVIVDALTQDAAGGVMIAVVNGTDATGGEVTHTPTFIGEFRPAVIATQYAAVLGLAPFDAVEGILF